ncbi:MAG: hypothetical protein C3F13_14640 [Anaerolineales bacterium]|nr:hypothetical protein [Anaerolineae bacterium]PWB51097.1 MAG: hypothetical protein C3F13_14640 [Anaerolineales bacterium]
MTSDAPEPALTYLQLREKVLSVNPAELGLAQSPTSSHVWGVLMETGYAVGSATLVCLVDGTTSLYLSTGGGLLGKPGSAPLVEASKGLVAEAEACLQLTSPAEEIPLPEAGQVRFTLLTYAGKRTIVAAEDRLSAVDQPLGPLYQAGRHTLFQLHSLTGQKHPQS